jgi:hypothetical protein
MTKTMQQLLQSSKHLIKLKFDTQQAVTAVKVQSDEQESMRRQKDERMRQVHTRWHAGHSALFVSSSSLKASAPGCSDSGGLYAVPD